MQKVTVRSNGHYSSEFIPPETSATSSNQAITTFNILTYQRRVLPILLAWATGSITAGGLWWRSEHSFWRGFGIQFLGWGAIDGLLALAGLRGVANNHAKFIGELPIAENARQTKRLEVIFWVNAGLDVLYMVGGKWLIDRPSTPSSKLDRRGMGWGVIFQSLFLFFFDLINALLLNSKRG